MNRNYTLANDGDPDEQAALPAFLEREFPQYEAYWVSHVVPLTRRPCGIGFKTNQQLRRSGYEPADLVLAQLHYTALIHLARAYEIRHAGISDPLSLHDAIVRLSSATDVADELLQRSVSQEDKVSKSPSKLRSKWRWSSGERARRGVRPVQQVRNYRNVVVHGRMPPSIYFDEFDPSTGQMSSHILYAPALGHEKRFHDWRSVVDRPQAVLKSLVERGLYVRADLVVEDAWNRVLSYFRTQWARQLLRK